PGSKPSRKHSERRNWRWARLRTNWSTFPGTDCHTMRILRPDDPAPGSKYRQYKTHLQPVFRFRCAYCQTYETRCGGFEGMTIDHFRPRDRYKHLLHTWSNLYYSCTVCNCRYKKNHPTKVEEAAGERFVDACEEDPDDHFPLVRCPKTNQLCC